MKPSFLATVTRRDSAPEGATARLLRRALDADRWLVPAVTRICAGLAPGESPVRVAVTVRCPGGTLACYTVGPAEGEAPVRHPAEGGRP